MTEGVASLWKGRFLEVRCRDTWEFVTRPNAHCVVAIVAITQKDELLLVEQFRRPLGKSVLELPAGLAGDDPGSQGEAPLLAAQRELLEETGYVSQHWTELMTGPTSAGLTDEIIFLFMAEKAVQAGAGGGVDSENITVHRVPLASAEKWLDDQARQGAVLDLKILAGLQFAQRKQSLR